jgi:hypothetical protein
VFDRPGRRVKSTSTIPCDLSMPSFTTATRRSIIRLVVVLAALAVPTSAFADCSHDIIDQAYKGRITKHYTQACYNAAIRIEPVDGSSYSDIDSIIRRAKSADALRDRDASVVSQPATSGNTPRTPQAHQQTTKTTTAKPEPPGTALVGGGRDYAGNVSAGNASSGTKTTPGNVTLLGAPSATPVLDRLAPAHAGDLPVAVIVLGVLAGLLVLAGIAGAILRRRASRSNS